MDAVRRITDQRQPFGGDRRGVVEAERIARARLEGRQRAEETAHALFGLDKESAIGELEHPGGVLRSNAPHDRRAMAGVVVGQRQQRERSEEHTSELQSLMRSSYAVF